MTRDAQWLSGFLDSDRIPAPMQQPGVSQTPVTPIPKDPMASMCMRMHARTHTHTHIPLHIQSDIYIQFINT